MAKCQTAVIHLPRHLEDVHHWPAAKARNAVQAYGLRKPYARTCPSEVAHNLESAMDCDVQSTSDNELQQIDDCGDDCGEVTSDDLLEFQKWLVSPDGGRKCQKSAKQHAFQVSVILASVDPNKSISSLWCRELLAKFLSVDVVAKAFLPGTVKSYLSSLRHFYSYLIAEEERHTLGPDDKQKIQLMSDRISRWICSYRKDAATRSLEKMDDDIDKLITPEKVAQFDRSKLALAAIKCIGNMTSEQPPALTMTDYVIARDYLLTQIIICNANRSGILSDVTVDDFKQARIVDGCFVISVGGHKTAYKYGPAKVVITTVLFNWLAVYIDKIRSTVVMYSSEQSDFLFLSWAGEQMEGGQITRAIQAAWKRAGLGKDITCTLMRKSAVSSIHRTHPEHKDNLADLMCHTTATASKSYRLVKRQESSVTASQVLTKLMKTPAAAQSDDPAHSATIQGSDPVSAARCEIPANDDEGSDDDFIAGSKSSSKLVFTNDDCEILVNICKEIINSGPISQRRIVDALMKCDSEEEACLKKFTMSQLISRIKYERRKLRRCNMPLFFKRK